MPRSTLTRLREIFPQASPFLMYGLTEAFRSTYLDPSEVDRRPDSIGKAIPDAEILVLQPDGTPCGPGRGGRAGPPRRARRPGLLGRRRPHRRAVPPRSRAAPTGARPSWPCGPATRVVADEEGFLYFVGRTDDMIKTSGYRVSPTEIEEVAYDSGLVRDAAALGLPDEALGHRVVVVVSPAVEGFEPDALLAAFRRQLPRYMVPAEIVVRDRAPPLAQREVRPGAAARGADRMRTTDARDPAHGTVDGDAARVGGVPVDRLAERVGSTPFFAYDRAMITERVAAVKAALPERVSLGYAVKANPMPAVVQHLAGLVDHLDVASAGELRRGARHRAGRRPRSASPGRARPTPSCDGRWPRA